MITIGEMRNMTVEELLKELYQAQHNLFRYRFTVRSGKEKSIHLLRKWKKQVAQIQTVINELKKEINTPTPSKKDKNIQEDSKKLIKENES